MSAQQDVQGAKSPRMALLMLAERIDALELKLKQLQEPGFDDWAGWVQGEPPPVSQSSQMDGERAHENLSPRDERPPAVVTPREITDEDAIAFIETHYGAPLPQPLDAEGRAAVAQVKADMINAPEAKNVDDFFRTTGDGVVESRIDWAPKSPQHYAARYDFAKRVLQLDVALGDHPTGGDWADDYAKAGPMWMYIPNRDLILQYPELVRSQMVADLQLYDERVAYEFAYDVLKKAMSTDRDGGAPQPVGYAEHQLG